MLALSLLIIFWIKVLKVFVNVSSLINELLNFQFFILRILHKSYSHLSSKRFAGDYCFNEGLPRFVSSLPSKNTLSSPAKMIRFSSEKFVFHEINKFV